MGASHKKIRLPVKTFFPALFDAVLVAIDISRLVNLALTLIAMLETKVFSSALYDTPLYIPT